MTAVSCDTQNAKEKEMPLPRGGNRRPEQEELGVVEGRIHSRWQQCEADGADYKLRVWSCQIR